MKEDIMKGKEAEAAIIEYNDYLITAMHPNPPHDRYKDHRSEDTKFQQTEENKHPSGRNTFVQYNEEEEDAHYSQLIDAVQRHNHGKYCNKKYKRPNGDLMTNKKTHKKNNDNCRGKFPRSKTSLTRLQVRELKTGRFVIEIVIATNDGWLNPHCRPLLYHHLANIDFRLTIDIGKIAGYMTKYVTKTESNENNRSRKQLLSTFKKASEGNATVAKTLTRLMNQVRYFIMILLIV